jgi:hypothetical protein
MTRIGLIAVVILQSAVIMAQTRASFAPAGEMTAARSFHTALLLNDGKVLITAGDAGSERTMELYDPADPRGATFKAIGTTLHNMYTTTLLDDGRVLVVGSDQFSGDAPDATIAQLFDPRQRTTTTTGRMVEAQVGGKATLLRNGKVLFVGGVTRQPRNGPAKIANPELYDPSTSTFRLTGAFATTGSTFFVTGGPDISAVARLSDGRVLIAGEPTSEVYDPVTETFKLTGMMTTPCVLGGRPEYIGGRRATLLTNGKVLLTGGAHEDCGRFADAELYDPSSGLFTPTGSMTRARDNHAATLMPDGTVLITGGESYDCAFRGCVFSGTTTSAESYDPRAGTFSRVGDMVDRRGGHTATLLNSGAVLIAGGYCFAGIGAFCGTFASVELYAPSVMVPAPTLFALSPDGRGDGAILHAGTRRVTSRRAIAGEVPTADNPALVGEVVEIYCRGVDDRIAPEIIIGDRRAEIVSVERVPEFVGVIRVNVRVPSGARAGSAVPVRLSYLGRTSNEVTMAIR